MGRFLDLLAKKRGQEDGGKLEREGEKKGKAVLKQANKDALASQKLQEALLAPSIKKSKAKQEAQEVVDHAPASEMGAPEFAEESVFSLLEASEFAEPADVSAFLETVQDQELADVLKNKDVFASFVAKRIVSESLESILSRPVVADSVLERSLAMHPKTKQNAEAIQAAHKEGLRIYNEFVKLGLGKQKLGEVVKNLRAAGLANEQVEAIQVVVDQLELQLEAVRQQQEANKAEQTALADQSKADASAIEASYRAEMAGVAERVGKAMQEIANVSPSAIHKNPDGRFELKIDQLSPEGNEILSQLIDEAATQAVDAEQLPDQRQKELNLRLLLETDWMQEFAHEHIQAAKQTNASFNSRYELYEISPETVAVWSTMVDVLKAGGKEKQDDPNVLEQFLNTEVSLYKDKRGGGWTPRYPVFERPMPSALPWIIARAENDPEMAKKMFDQKSLFYAPLRSEYLEDSSWRSAESTLESISMDLVDRMMALSKLGPKYKADKGFQGIINTVGTEFMYAENSAVYARGGLREQPKTFLKSLIPFADKATTDQLVFVAETALRRRHGPHVSDRDFHLPSHSIDVLRIVSPSHPWLNR